MAAVIELTALTKRYGATVGIQQLDLRVEAGEVFGFLGPNGAGKTTTASRRSGFISCILEQAVSTNRRYSLLVRKQNERGERRAYRSRY